MSQGMLNRLAFLFVVYLGTFALACGIRGYHWASYGPDDTSKGDVTHASQAGARVVVPNKGGRVTWRAQAGVDRYMLYREQDGPDKSAGNPYKDVKIYGDGPCLGEHPDPSCFHTGGLEPPYQLVATVTHTHCGVERWAVKTLGDDNGNVVYTMPVWDTTIDNLLTSKAPTRAALQAADAKRFPEELHKVRVPALIMGYKQEADSDYHIVLARPENLKQTLIAEIPAPTCVPPQYAAAFSELRRRFIKEVGAPIARFTNLAHPMKVHATGIAFFDFLHGQTGVAPNGIELHPLLDWTKD